ncbi:DCC1-like thiol-disulfide oxidoreductase family protein [Chryseolinea soli]|uniref:DUF393 domain-containing protein n=1 Tax=Chryseolinea soli TaxID=2321403 RepID=A0A385SSH5_9BACT|nr:DCC1-like thiol-disulfide oxidoreductase family protein [Chryseolinea soli]AYB33097.1 DUF393 domain-containing protein [Chryseolinea soli]
MIRYLIDVIERAYTKKIDGSGLALFRIVYGVVLLCEVIQLFYFRHLVFDKIPYLSPSEIDFAIPLIFWMISLVFLIVGLYTRYAAIVNYILSVTLIGTIQSYEYHMFYMFVGTNFLLIFLNVSQVNSLDRLRSKLKYSTTRFQLEPTRKVNALHYYAIPLMSVGFTYLDSVFFKLTSHIWLSGLGMWAPVSLPQTTQFNVSFLLNLKWVMLGLGYITLIFELLFIFLFWRKKWRWFLFVVGVGLHIGIVVMFPIPWFGLGMMSFYLLLVPVGTWSKIRKAFQAKKPLLEFFYDEECPLCIRVKIILSHFDVFNVIEFKSVQRYAAQTPALSNYSQEQLLNSIFSVSSKGKVLKGIDTYIFVFLRLPALFPLGLIMKFPGVYQISKLVYRKVAEDRVVERCTEDNCGYTPVPVYIADTDNIKLLKNLTLKQFKIRVITFLLVFFVILQLNVSYNSDLVNAVKTKIGFKNSAPERIIQKITSPARKFSKIYFGICHHPLFLDSHFDGYNHIIAIEAVGENGKTYWLPIIDKNGMPGSYLYGFVWAKWTFRVNSPRINQNRLAQGIRDFTAFWATNNGIPLNKFKFNVYVKKVEVPSQWKLDHLNNQIKQNWQLAGEAHWEGDNFVSSLKQIEDL